MKSFINKIKLVSLALIASLSFSASVQALSITNFTLASGLSTNLLFSVPVNITSIKVTATTLPTGSNAVVNFMDSSSSNTVVYVRAAYTNYTTVKTNLTDISTNSFGNLQTNTYPGQWTYIASMPQTTNALPVITSFNVPANTSVTQTANIVTGLGLIAQTMNNITNVVVEVTYSTSP